MISTQSLTCKFRFIEKPEANENVPKEHITYPDPEVERDVYIRPTATSDILMTSAYPADVNAFQNQQFMELLQSLSGFPGTSLNNPNNFADFNNLNGLDPFASQPIPDTTPPPQDSILDKVLKSKIHFLVLSILTYSFIRVTSITCSVFLIFLLWEIIEIIISRQHKSNPNHFVSLIFMFAGVSPTKINVAIKWTQLINKVFRDVAIFVFFFVFSHLCHIHLGGDKAVKIHDNSYGLDNTFEL